MTRLHRAVYYNQEGIVYDILEWAVVKKKKPEVAEWIVNCVACDDDGFTPFYVAFARGHKELCTKIMQFLQQVLRQEELEEYMADEKGFLQSALREVIIFEEIEMFEMILTNSKRIFGQFPWECVSMSENWRCRYIPLIMYRKNRFESIAKLIIADEPNNERYKNLSDFVFLNVDYVDKVLIHFLPPETLEKMFETDGGIRIWMRRFLKTKGGLARLEDIIQSEMTHSNDFRDQLMQFGREIIDERAADIAKESSRHDGGRVYAWSLLNLFDCGILRCLGKESVEKLILGDDDGEAVTRIILSDGLDSWGTVAFILIQDLPGEKVISTKIIDRALKMVELNSLVPQKKYSDGFMSISLLLLDHGSDEELRQFVDLISTPYPEDNGTIWIDFLSQCERKLWGRHFYVGYYMEKLRQCKMEREMRYSEDKKKDYEEIEYWIVDLFLHFVKNKLGDTIVQRLVRKDVINVVESKDELANVLKKYVNDKYLETETKPHYKLVSR